MAGPVYNCVWMFLCTLYPAYASFKAVKTKNVKEYVSQTLNCESAGDDVDVSGEVYDVLDSVRSLLGHRESLGSIWKYFSSILH